tara:strand:+ start:1054 stop:1290 length:237 start_codon:yes stop_codon:yes gene_type:complete
MANNVDGLHPADVERLHKVPPTTSAEFTVQFKSVDNSLTLTVDGDVRNRIKLDDASTGFDLLLKLVKEQFIKWRSPKN